IMKLAINGFGRIGRPSLKIALAKKDVEVVAVNDLTDLKTAAYLLKNDSSYGRYDKEVSIDEANGELIIGGKKIKFLAEPDPEKLPGKDLGGELVQECTG